MRARVFIIAVGSDEMRRQTLGDPLHERRAGGFFLGKLPPQHFQGFWHPAPKAPLPPERKVEG